MIAEPPTRAPQVVRWWQTLSFRLGLVINLTAVVVLGAFWLLDYRREWDTHVGQEAERLREEARVLVAARAHLTDDAEYVGFVDAFCRQMQSSVSPRHHIMVLNAAGTPLASTHAHTGRKLAAELLLRSAQPEGTFLIDGEHYVSVTVMSAAGERIIVTQSLARVREIIHSQATSRGLSLALLAALVFGGTTIALFNWVRSPLAALVRGVRAIEQREFHTRMKPSGTAELRFLAGGFNEMASALEAAEKQRQAQMRRAREIQSRLLPHEHLAGNACDITAFFEPAESVGGDLYDVVALADGATLVAVMDVSGHGVAPALYTALLRTVLRHEARLTNDPGQLLDAMNREMLAVARGSGDFATCFLCRIERGAQRVRYASAGHDPGILLATNASLTTLDEHGMPLGVSDAEVYAAADAELPAGARLFLYTDGLHEVADAGGKLFGRQRLLDCLRATNRADTRSQIAQVVSEVRAFASDERFADDVTLICIQPVAA